MTGDETLAEKTARDLISSGVDPLKGVNTLSATMKMIGEKFSKEQVFLPEMLLASDATNVGLSILKPHIEVERLKAPGRFVIGTVQGDIHNIGKNFVASMLTAAGFEVYDLGIDVPPQKFVEKALEVRADLIGSSALMTTTMFFQRDIERELKKAGVRDRFRTLVGGSATNPRWAEKIGADAWAKDALAAVTKAKELVKRE
jgi:corrinoid protein of di/trimethylamine methyltransferase